MESNSSLKALAFVFLILMGAIDAFPLDPSWKISEYVQENYRARNGLAQDSVLSIARTRDGYLWFGGYQGVERFDGVRFVPLETPENADYHMLLINALFSDSNGELWIATLEGLFRYDGNSIKRYVAQDGLPAEWIFSIAEDPQKNLWLGTHNGLIKFDRHKFSIVGKDQGLSDNEAHYVEVDPDGTIWIGTQDGLSILRDGKFRVLTTRDGLPNNVVWSVVRDPDGSHWIGTEGGVSHLQNGVFTNYTSANGLPNNVVNCMTQDSHGVVWVGTEGGMARIEKSRVDSFTYKDGLPKDAVWAILEDAEGTIWVGMSNGGVSRFTEGKMKVLGKREGLTGDVTGIVYQDAENAFWIGTDEGLNRFKDGKITQYTTNQGLAANFVTSLLKDSDGNLWIGTMAGLNRLSPSGDIASYSVKDGLLDPIVLSMMEDDHGIIWVGSNNGLNQWDGKKFTAVSGMLRGTVFSMVQDRQGTVWVATRGGLKYFKNGMAGNYEQKDGLPTDRLASLHIDEEGTMWIGTSGAGLVRFQSGKFRTIRSRDGLRVDSIASIVEDSDKHLWLGSNKGIVRVSKQQLNDFADRKISTVEAEIFGLSDGMRNAECFDGQSPSAWKDNTGKLWFATLGGAVVIDPHRMRTNPVPPPVVVEQMIVAGKALPANKFQSLPPGVSDFEMEFTALSFMAPEKVRFQYRLEGFDSRWMDSGTRRIAQYTNIRPGHYRFEVRACNNDGVWNLRGAAFSFYLQPHFYQTFWFYGLCAAAILFAVWRIHLYSIRRALEIERIRTRIATDLHDDIGAGLSQIAVITEVLRKDLANSESGISEKLTTISTGAHELIGSMSDIVWAVNPTRDKMESLVQRMRKFALDLLSNADIDVEFNADDLYGNRKLSPDFKRNVYLIFKECLNNIVKHSHGKSVKIDLHADHSGLKLEIRDNGRGFVINPSSDGHGLRSMQSRAEAVGGRLQIDSTPGEGTTVSLTASF